MFYRHRRRRREEIVHFIYEYIRAAVHNTTHGLVVVTFELFLLLLATLQCNRRGGVAVAKRTATSWTYRYANERRLLFIV